MNSSFLDSPIATFNKRTGKGPAAVKGGGRPRMQANRRHRFRLSLEPLEDRLVLSNLLVTSSVDLLNTPGTLRDAVNQANLDGAQGIADSIYFASGLNGAHILLQLGHLELKAGANVNIWGSFPGDASGIVLNGDSDNIFQVDSGATLVLHELTLAGGTAVNGDGGAINTAGTLDLRFCTLTDNAATFSGDSGSYGGAIYNTGTLLTSYPSTFTNNSAWAGGAIANGPGGTATLESDTFSGNSALEGGAIFSVSNIGLPATMTLVGCTLNDNSATFGGGLYNESTTTLINTTLAGNTAIDTSNGIGYGGAIYNSYVLTLSATTVSANSSNWGGGIINGDSLTLVDSIVAGNTLTGPNAVDPDVASNPTANGADNLIGDGTGLSGISNGVNGNRVGSSGAPINPLLAPLGAYGGPTETMPLLIGSPALSAGGPVTTLTAAIGAQDTVIPVADAAAIASTALEWTLQIDSEQLTVTNVDLTNNTLTVIRGLFGGATGHNAGAGVYFAYDQRGDAVPLPNAPAMGAVQPAATATGVTAAPSPALLGQPVDFTATVGNTSGTTETPAGTVQFQVDGNNYGQPVALDSNGQASTTDSALSAGSHSIVAVYRATGIDFTGSQGSTTELIQTPTSTSVTATPNPALELGQALTFTATVSSNGGTPTGSVQFQVDGSNFGAPVTLNGGQAQIPDSDSGTSALALGSHSIVAVYIPTGNFVASQGSTTEVIGVLTSTSVTADPSPLVLQNFEEGDDSDEGEFAQPEVTFTATVSNANSGGATPTGSVQFLIDGSDDGTPVTLDSNGQANATYDAFDLGSYTITAVYSPTGNFAPSQGTTTEAVEAATATDLAATPALGVLGQPVLLTATVANDFSDGGTPTGSVDFFDITTNTDLGSATLSNGTANLSTSSLSLGSNTIAATYTPSGNFATSEGFATEQVDVGDYLTNLAGGAWDDPGNWSNGVPQSGYDVYVSNLQANAVITLGPADVANNVTVSSPLTFSGGKLAIGGSLTDSAPLTVSAGATLSVSRPFATSAVTVMASSTLSGPGTVNGNLVNDGEVDMGSAPGVIKVMDDYTQAATGVLTVKIAGAVGTEFDQLDVLGTATFAGTLNATLMNGFAPVAGDTFSVLGLVHPPVGGFSSFTSPVNNGVLELDVVNTPSGLSLAGTSGPAATVTFPGEPVWQAEGPAPIGAGTFPASVGAIESIVVAPSGTVYAGTVNGGVWRSDSISWTLFAGGYPFWTPLTDPEPSLSVASMALDPEDPSGNTLWVGTGDESSNGTGGPSVGLLKTINGGNSWIHLGASTFNTQITTVLPTGTPDATTGKEVVLIATAGQGLWRYDGVNFTQVGYGVSFGDLYPQADVTSLVQDPQNPDRFYAALAQVGIFESVDDGLGWYEIDAYTPGLFESPNTKLATTINDDGNTNLYAVAAETSTDKSTAPWNAVLAGVWRTEITSNPIAVNWLPISNTPTSDNLVEGRGGAHLTIAPDPTDPNIVYVAGPVQDLYRVTVTGVAADGKSLIGSWSHLSGGSLGAPHDDQRFITFLNNNTMLEANDGGMWALTNPAAPGPSDHWVALNGDIQDTEFFDVAYDSINGVIFGGTQDNSTPVQIAPNSTPWISMGSGDGGQVAVDNSGTQSVDYFFEDDKLYYALNSQPNTATTPTLAPPGGGAQNGGLNSADEATETTPADFSYPIAVNAFSDASPEPLLLGITGVYESLDKGATIANVSPSNMAGHVSAITYADAHGTAYFCTNKGQLFLRDHGPDGSPDAGFQLIPSPPAWLTPTGANNGTYAYQIVTDPDSPYIVYVVDKTGGIFRGTMADNAWTWTNLTGNLASNLTGGVLRADQLAVYNPTGTPGAGVLLAGAYPGGVYRLFPEPGDFTPSWSLYGQGLPNAYVSHVQYIPLNTTTGYGNLVLVGTFGRGAWIIPDASASLMTPAQVGVAATNATIVLCNDPTNPNNAQVLVDNQLDMDLPWSALPQLTIDTSTGSASTDVDDVEIEAVAQGTSVVVDAGLGTEMVNVGSYGNILRTFIGGSVTVEGPSPGSGNCTLNIDDQDDTLAGTWIIGAGRVANSAWTGSVKYQSVDHVFFNGGAASSYFEVTDTSGINTDLTLNTGTASGNQVEVDSTGASITLNINNSGSSTTTAVVSTGHGSNTYINDSAESNFIILGNDGTREGSLSSTVQGIQGNVSINSTPVDSDTLDVNDSTDPQSHSHNPVTVTNDSIDGLAPGNINYGSHALASLSIEGSTGGTTWNVQSTEGDVLVPVLIPTVRGYIIGQSLLTTTTTINCDGQDTVNVGDADGVQDIMGALIVHGNSPDVVGLIVNDQADKATGESVAITTTSVSGLAPADINFGTLSANGTLTPDSLLQLTVNAGSGGTTFTVGSLVGGPASVSLSALGTGNTIVGPNTDALWQFKLVNNQVQDYLSQVNGGPIVNFADMQTIQGGTGNDDFQFIGAVGFAGTIDGGGGTNTLDYSGYGGNSPITVNLQTNTATGIGGFANIQSFVGSATIADSLVGANTTNTWSITAADEGTVNSNAFSGFANLTGGTAADTFAFEGGGLSGKIDGGGGINTLEYFLSTPVTVNLQTNTATGIGGFANIQSFGGSATIADTLVGANTTNTWTITATNEGTVNSIAFSGFANLTGGPAADTFAVEGGGVSGKIDGGGGINTLEYFLSTPVTVNLQTDTATGTGGFANIQSFVGSATIAETLVGANTTNTWSITATNEGTVNSIAFSGFANLTGGTAMDIFVFSSGATVKGVINGGGGSDWLDYAAYTTAVTVNLSTGVATGVGGGIANIQNVRGGQGTDKLTGSSQGNILIGGAGANTITGGSGKSILIGDKGKDSVAGGSGSDILVGGYTSYDSSSLANDLALEAILEEWQSSGSYSARISAIKSGVGPSKADKLVWGTTVFDNSTSDANTLTGAGGTEGANWFFANVAHTKTNRTPKEASNQAADPGPATRRAGPRQRRRSDIDKQHSLARSQNHSILPIADLSPFPASRPR
ncbi:MAG: beta strand repeat-containing protein [Isosphaeraceae bacterium]